MSVFQLLYVSAAAKGVDQAEIEAILASARARNAAQNVTGMLLYADRSFLQVLEGVQADVEAIFARIAKDPRHTGLSVLLEYNVPERNFREWSMGFERLQASDQAQMNAIFQINGGAIRQRMTPAQADQVMVFMRNS